MCTHAVVGYNIHMIQGIEISLCRAFCAMRFLYCNLSTAKNSKTYRAKVSTADSSNVNFFSCCCAEELVFLEK